MDFQDKKIHKKVWVCEREYEISLLQSEEVSFDAVIRVIQEKILDLRSKFPNSDERDILVMSLIQLVTKDISAEKEEIGGVEMKGRLEAIMSAIEESLTPNQSP